VEEVAPVLVVKVVGIIVGIKVGTRVFVVVGDMDGKIVVGVGVGELVRSGVGFLVG
jgi:hypothetical protein